MVPELLHDGRSEDFMGMGASWNSGQTTLTWRRACYILQCATA
jgi:hypothetical protein